MWFSNVNTKFVISLLKLVIMNGLIVINETEIVFEKKKLSRNPISMMKRNREHDAKKIEF